jgi:hypothetical protein
VEGSAISQHHTEPLRDAARKGARMDETFVLHQDWFTCVVVKGVNEANPGIYRWTIDGAGSYIGKYKSIHRPKEQYGQNVRRLLQGGDYRKSKPDAYRRIHRELAHAVREGRKIELFILENVDPANINARERELIRLYGNLNGPIIVQKSN